MRRLSYVIVMALVITSLWSARADAVGTIDQQQNVVPRLDAGDTIGEADHNVLAQVFTAGVTNQLTDVDLPVILCSGTATLTIAIRDTVAFGARFVPGNTVLTSGSFPINALPPEDASHFRTFSFPAPAAISAGTHYAIVVSANTAFPNSCALPEGPVGDSYAGGDGWFINDLQRSSTTPGGWLCLCDAGSPSTHPFDFPFRTRVAAAIADLGVTVMSVPTSAFGTTQMYRYDVTLTNYGPNVASFAGVALTPSSNLRIDGYPIAYCITTPNFNCGVSNLGVNGSITFNIFVTAQFGLTASMGATTQSSLPDFNTANNNAISTTVINPVVDLKVDSIAAYQGTAPTAVTQVGVGDAYYYKVVIKNNGNYDAHSAVASMQLPTGTSFVNVSGPGAAFCGQDTNPLIYGCNFGTLTAGSTATMFLEVTAPPLAQILSATANATATEPEATPLDNSASTQITVVGEQVSQTVGAGGSVSTGSTAIPTDPVETTVTTPNPGTVTIREVPTTAQNGTTGYNLIDQQVIITAPSATATSPLVLLFEIDASKLYPPTASTITIFRNGVAVGNCPGQTTASPDPCVSDRTTLANGNVRLTVLTSAASRWNFGIHVPYAFIGFFEPLDGKTTAQAGSAIPVTFSLSGNQGLGVVATAQSRPCAGGTAEGTATPGGSSLTYDATTDRYQLNWKTKKEWAGSCRELVLTLMDGSVHTARVSFH
jgi:uncharacterized repeat protein (TIGR01451 family)